MLIRRKLQWGSLGLVLLAAAVLLGTWRIMDRADKEVSRASLYMRIQNKGFALINLATGFPAGFEGRRERQWRDAHASMGTLLDGLEGETPFESHSIATIRRRHAQSWEIFERYAALRARPPQNLPAERTRRALDELRVNLLQITDESKLLVTTSMTTALQSEKRATMVVVGLVGGLCAMVLGAALFMSARMTRAFAGMDRGIREVEAGNLDNPVLVVDGDEFARLAAAFNRMAERLKRSRARLDSQAEALRRSNEELESRVAERTHDLRRREAEYRSLLEGLPKTNVARYDDECRFLFASPSILRSLGLAKEQVIGRRPTEAPMDQEFVRTLENAIRRVLDTGEEVTFQHAYMTVEGMCFREFTVIPELREDGRVKTVVLTSYDITDMKKLEGELLEAKEQAEGRAADLKKAQAELMRSHAELEDRVRERTSDLEAANAEMEAFSYSVSHDLRAPLRTIEGFSQIVHDQYAQILDERGRDYLERIRRAVLRMEALIDDILRLSRLGRASMAIEDVDLSLTALSVLEELKERDPGRTVEVSVQPGMVVPGDRRLLRAALENILGNAWKFTEKTHNARIEVQGLQEGESFLFSVRDNGAGFNPAYAGKLFKPFQRLHSEKDFQGTGIGLALVQRIANRHGGHVRAEGEPGKGAAFHLSLPARRKANGQTHDPAGRG